MSAFYDIVNQHDPDVICITGDLTSCGDIESLAKAKEILDYIKNRGQATDRKIIVVPGNHDLLEEKILEAVNRFQRWTKRGFRLAPILPRSVRKIIKFLKRNYQNQTRPIKHNFLDQITRYYPANLEEPIRYNKNNIELLFFPFNSTRRDPLWINAGQIAPEDYRIFSRSLNKIQYNEPELYQKSIKIALLHHYPISSPDIIEPDSVRIYNSMIDSATFLNAISSHNIDIVLYGHQHSFNYFAITFSPYSLGRMHIIGADNLLVDGANSSFNVINVDTPVTGTCKQWQFRNNVFQPAPVEPKNLWFVKNEYADPQMVQALAEIRNIDDSVHTREIDFD